MRRTVSVLLLFLSGSIFWFAGTHGHAGRADQAVNNAQKSPRVVRYRSDHYRDPFVPKSVASNPADSSLEAKDVNRQTVRVVGTLSSVHGRWAMLEFEDGERLIVVPGQVIPAYSRVVKRVTEEGVTLSATGARASPQVERTYRLDEERDFLEPRSREDS